MHDAKIKILVIEDDRAQSELIAEMLASDQRQQYEVHLVRYLAQGLEAFTNGEFDCVLVDLGLPDSQGLETALSVRRQAKEVPIVVLTVLDDEEAALKALELNIQDYLIKSEINSSLLSRSIRYAMQRMLVATQLLESEERLRYASDATNMGIWNWDLVRDELTLSDKSKELFGFPLQAQTSYREIMEKIHPDDRQRVEDAFQLALRENREYAAEMRVMLPDGKVRWLVSRGHAYYDGKGNPLRTDGINIDITERKRGEEALLRANEQWERTFNNLPDLIAILDTDNRILRVNRALAEWVGKTPEQCVGLPCYTVIHGTDAPPPSCPHIKAAAESRQQIEEIRQLSSDSYFLVSYTPVLDRDGKPAGMVHVARDITERKQAERRIEQLNQELEQRAADLEAANKELEAFNYTAAHDLRQPLNVIFGYCQAIEMLCGSQLNDECRAYVQDIYHGVKRMTRLIDALLNFSRMSKVELRRSTVDLSATAKTVARDLQETEPGRGITFQIRDGVQVNGDPMLLAIVLQNLLGNAWKYAGAKEDVVIEFGVAEVEGKKACFVRDNGPGFDMAQAGKLFAPFQRLPGREAVHGFGIGLATVARIIHRHGGRVWAEGEPGVGATFYFTLE